MMRVKCSLCDQFYFARNPKPIGKNAAAHFHRPAKSYICFWCVFDDYERAASFEEEPDLVA